MADEIQVKNSFDKETLRKIGNSFVLTLIGAIGVVGISVAKGVPFKEALLLASGTLLAWFKNILDEYTKGIVVDK